MTFDCILANPPYGKTGTYITNHLIKKYNICVNILNVRYEWKYLANNRQKLNECPRKSFLGLF